MNVRVKACESVRVCLSTRGKLARERFNKRVISKNSVRRTKTQDELRLAKKKKKCTRDKKSFVSCILNKNRERIGLLLWQDGVLLRNGREKVELARPLLLCVSLGRSSDHPSKLSSAHQTWAPSTRPARDGGKTEPLCKACGFPNLATPGRGASCSRPLERRSSEMGWEQKPRNASMLPGW